MTLDVFGLPPASRADVQIFNRPSTVTNTQWTTWTKPRGVTMAHILCIGGGGGGGAGFYTAPVNWGGSGGASSGIARLTIPAMFLPDTLFVQVGAGGTGGQTLGANGQPGVASYVSIYSAPAQANLAENLVLYSGGAAGGGPGGSSSSSAGGVAATIALASSCVFSSLGVFLAVAGQDGASNGAIDVALSGAAGRCYGGCAGANYSSTALAGGKYTGTAGTWPNEVKPVGAAAGANSGSSGPAIWAPFTMFGGSGGSSIGLGQPGTGGNGAYGAGGGGGGGGGNNFGKGGDGGTGLVIIVAW